MELFNNSTLQEIGVLLIDRKETLAVAESVTSGAIQLAISNIKNASRFFQGGITAFNIMQKFHHLAVEPMHALEVNCVSEEVARQMALNVAKRFSSTWAISITGYAVPAPESGGQVFAYYAVAYNGKVMSCAKIDPQEDEPVKLQLFYANEVCERLKDALLVK
ncbi:MAG: nicotinamide-nucleotide amidohydrolase family protein [Chitinophagaceae bacterium]|nr:MAG: nicotinamide-nucleotide amidohydrolase family protein [Chitinophagaceae bacterium]